jgi:hypothetical protein
VASLGVVVPETLVEDIVGGGLEGWRGGWFGLFCFVVTKEGDGVWVG